MQIPVLQSQSIGLDAPMQQEIKAPSPVPGAFGGDIASATQKIGEAGVGLTETLQRHIYQENLWRDQATVADRSLRLKNQFQDMATSTDPSTTFKPGNSPSNSAPFIPPTDAQTQDIEQPKGYLNRIGFNATGSTQEFINNALPIKNQFLSEFKNSPQIYKIAANKFDEIYSSYYDQVSKHEATQYRLGMNNTFNAQTTGTITSAAAANDPESLKAGIDQIKAVTAQQYQYRGDEDAVAQVATQKNIADAVSRAVVNKLMSTGDLAQAKSMLDTAKDEIPYDRYEKIDSMLTTGHQRLQEQAEIATVQKQISGQANVLNQFAAGKGGWMNLDDVAGLVEQGVVSEKFARAYSDVIASKGNYQPREEINENFPKFVDAIYNAKDQGTIHNTLIDMMEQHKGMSQDAMAVLINSALKRSGTLPLEIRLGSGNHDPKQLQIDSGARSVVNFARRNNLTPDETNFVYTNYYNKVANGGSVLDALNDATKQYAIAKYPSVSTMEGTPTAIAGPDSGVKYLHFNSNTNVYPARVWNPKTGVFDVNTNRAKTAKGDQQK